MGVGTPGESGRCQTGQYGEGSVVEDTPGESDRCWTDYYGECDGGWVRAHQVNLVGVGLATMGSVMEGG